MVNSPLFLLLLFLPAVILFINRKKKRTKGSIISLILYTFCAILTVLALSGFGVIRDKAREYTVFVVDVSDSVTEQSRIRETEIIERRLKEINPEDFTGIVLFGEKAMIERNLQQGLRHLTFESRVSGRATNIEEAIYKAVGMFPQGGKRSIVLFSDGLENNGNSREAAARAASAGIKIYTIPLKTEKPDSEVYIDNFIVPERVARNQIHDYSLIVGSTVQTKGRVTFFLDGKYMGEELLSLYKGLNTFTYSSKIEEAGIHEYRAVIEPETDTFRENNAMSVPVTVTGEPEVLIVGGEDSSYLADALSVQNIRYDLIDPGKFPGKAGVLLKYDSIIFNNVPSGAISLSKMNLIKDFVKNKGGGFIMIGGDKSFGAGGYYDTPIEEILPVDMDVTSSLQIPSLTMIMVIDRSGSMKSSVDRGTVKLDVAKEAIMEAVEILNPFYKVGVIAFNTDYYFAVPMINAGETETIREQLMKVEPRGGTSLYPAMEAAYQELLQSDSSVRHMIILSDGLSEEGNFEELSRKIGADGITVSTVAVGNDSDRKLMKDIAAEGGGRSYFTSDIRDVPRIFASESYIVSRAHIVEETFLPVQMVRHSIVDGFPEGYPALDGFVLTYPKSGATQILTTIGNQPLLSAWKFGLGRTAAWTSDFSGRWAGAFVSWEKFPKFAGQLVRWVQRPVREHALDFRFSGSGSKRIMVINGKDKNGEYINLLNLKAIITSPDGTEQTIDVPQIGPGLYRAEFDLPSEGTSIITAYDGQNRIEPEYAGISLPYSAEFRPMQEDFTLLTELSESTGGSLLNGEYPDFSLINAEGSATVRVMKPQLILLILLVFTANIILRLLYGRSDNREREGTSDNLDELRLKIDNGRKERYYNRKKDNYWFS